jgi:hypothetical protein
MNVCSGDEGSTEHRNAKVHCTRIAIAIKQACWTRAIDPSATLTALTLSLRSDDRPCDQVAPFDGDQRCGSNSAARFAGCVGNGLNALALKQHRRQCLDRHGSLVLCQAQAPGVMKTMLNCRERSPRRATHSPILPR